MKRYRGTFDDRDEARAFAVHCQRPNVVEEDGDGFAVFELHLRGADGVDRDPRYPSLWGLENAG